MTHRMPAGILAALVLWIGFSILGTPAEAQDRKQEKPARQEQISEEATKHLAELDDAFRASLDEWRAEQKAAVDAAIAKGGPIPAMRMAPPTKLVAKHLAEFQKAATKYEGREDAIPFHLWILKNGAAAESRRSINLSLSVLMQHHMRSPLMIDAPDAMMAAGQLIPADRRATILEELEKVNPDVNVQAAAALGRLSHVIQRAPMKAPEYAAAKKHLLQLKGKATNAELQTKIQALIDSREGMADGDVAPEITGLDMDGVEFKLTDYKGKIVLHDFWGDW